MSRRLPASLLLGVFLLVSLGPLLLAGPAAAFGERTYESNPVVSTANLDVFSGQSVAQSFVATETYKLLRVTLRLSNPSGSADTIKVSIRTDENARPSDASLASRDVTTGTAISLVDVPLAEEPTLERGARYWIVGEKSGLLAAGYRWYRSPDGQNSFPNGWAMTDSNLGPGWVNTTFVTDMNFATFGRELDANMTVAIVATTTEAMARDLVTFSVYYNNTGTLAAQSVWVNDTLPAGLIYVSDTASGSASPFPSYTFTDVPNGAHSFTLTARVGVGLEPGTVLAHGVALAYANATGTMRPGSTAQATLTIGIVTKELYLKPDPSPPYVLSTSRPTGGLAQQATISLNQGDPPVDFDLTPELARPFRAVDLDVVLFIDSDQNQPEDINLVVTLADWNGVSLVVVTSRVARITTNNFDDFERFTIPFSAFDYTFAGSHRIRLRLSNLGNSTGHADLAINSTFADSRAELRTTTYVSVDAIELADLSGPATTWTALDGLVVRANVSDPFGSGDILTARIRITSASGAVLVDDVTMTLVATDASSPSAWRVFEYGRPPTLDNGSYVIEVAGVETNGVVDVARATVPVASPELTVEKLATAANVRSGDRFFYRIWVNNTGGATAGPVWVNDTIPSEVAFLTSSEEGNRTGASNWTWAMLAPGSRLLVVEVEVRSGIPQVPFFRNTVTVDHEDEKGHRWPRRTAYVDVVLNGPVLVLTKTADRATAHAGEFVAFTIEMTNAGEIAPTLWLNDTLPAGLAYVSNTAGTIGGTVWFGGGMIHFLFENLTGGTSWSFELLTQTASGLTPGTELTNLATLDYTNANGALMPKRSANASVTSVAPRITGAVVTMTPPQVRAGDPVRVTVDFANMGNEPAPGLWLNLSLDSGLGFVNASRPASVAGNLVRFTLARVDVGSHHVFLNVSVTTTATDGQALPITASIDYADANGNGFPRVIPTADSVTVSGPRLLVSASPADLTAEAGEVVAVTVLHNNAGSGVAGDVWLNLSLPASFVYVTDTSDGDRTVSGTTISWHWTNRAAGSGSFTLSLRAKTTAPDGGSASLVFGTEYTDLNGNERVAIPATINVEFVAPVIELSLAVTPGEFLPGITFTYTLRMENTGSAVASRVWLVDEVDDRLEVVLYRSRVLANESGPFNWTFADVLPGQVETIEIDVRVVEGIPARTPIGNVLEAYYTNSEGVLVGYVRSSPLAVVVAADTMVLWYVTIGGLALATIPLAVAIRRRGVNIEEVFLVYRDGVLMYHLSRTLVEEKDEDVLSGMLTAVQEFVRDAFRYGEHRELHQLDFGDYKILIERGKLVYLAIVYSGHESSAVRKRVRKVLDRIELTYGQALERWDGDMDRVIGAQDVIRNHLLRPNGRRGKPAA